MFTYTLYCIFIIHTTKEPSNHFSYSTRLQSGGIFEGLGPGESDKVAIPPEGLSGDQGRNSYQ